MTRACAVGTNNFEKESGTPFFKLSAITVDWNSICLILSNRDAKLLMF